MPTLVVLVLVTNALHVTSKAAKQVPPTSRAKRAVPTSLGTVSIMPQTQKRSSFPPRRVHCKGKPHATDGSKLLPP